MEEEENMWYDYLREIRVYGNGDVLQIWMIVSCQYSFDKLILKDKDINELIQGSVAYNSKKVKNIAAKLYNAIYQKSN